MSSLPLAGILVAESSDRFAEMFSRFRERPGEIDTQYLVTGLVVIATLIAVLWVVSRLVLGRERRGPYESPGGLFHALCQAHALPWSDRWLLWQIARQRGLADPACLFLEPKHLEVDGLSRGLAAKHERLAALREQLFEGLEEGLPLFAAGPPASRAMDSAPQPGPAFPRVASPGLDLPPWSKSARTGDLELAPRGSPPEISGLDLL